MEDESMYVDSDSDSGGSDDSDMVGDGDSDADGSGTETAAASAPTYVVNLPEARKTKSVVRSNEKTLTASEAEINPQLNRLAKDEQRKKKKRLAKAAKAQQSSNVGEEMAMEEESDDGNDDYNFGTYFKQTADVNAGSDMASDSDDEDL
ncbi:hypothetical protein GGI22_008098 [Coemansia erecta]|nr:hypothetical protein GGI22_008098 [Coemansia erecta]